MVRSRISTKCRPTCIVENGLNSGTTYRHGSLSHTWLAINVSTTYVDLHTSWLTWRSWRVGGTKLWRYIPTKIPYGPLKFRFAFSVVVREAQKLLWGHANFFLSKSKSNASMRKYCFPWATNRRENKSIGKNNTAILMMTMWKAKLRTKCSRDFKSLYGGPFWVNLCRCISLF